MLSHAYNEEKRQKKWLQEQKEKLLAWECEQQEKEEKDKEEKIKRLAAFEEKRKRLQAFLYILTHSLTIQLSTILPPSHLLVTLTQS